MVSVAGAGRGPGLIVHTTGVPAEPTRAFSVREVQWEADQSALRAVRFEVFVLEQRVAEDLEWDGIDAQCRHVLALDPQGRAIGTGRLLPDGHIGRMAVLGAWRGCGVGSAMLALLIDLARRDHAEVRLNAQVHAMPFYARFGFTPEGDPFDEAGIPHRSMKRAL
jgi:predicted GNAT family N-acyltransferase